MPAEMVTREIVMNCSIKIRDNMAHPFPSLDWLVNRLSGDVVMTPRENAIIIYYATLSDTGHLYYPFINDEGATVGGLYLNDARSFTPEGVIMIRALWEELSPNIEEFTADL